MTVDLKGFDGKWEHGDFYHTNLGDIFRLACVEIVNDKAKFASFKNHPTFCAVVGTDMRPRSAVISEYLSLENSDLLKKITHFAENCTVGSPMLYYFAKTGIISPGTIHFLSILNKINLILGDVKGKSVCEIGSGYGGQANIFLKYGAAHVTLVDLIEPLTLANKYLSLFGWSAENVSYFGSNKVPTKPSQKFDLAFSSWAICELDKTGMEFYINNTIKHSHSAFFQLNLDHVVVKDKMMWFLEQLQGIFKNVMVQPGIGANDVKPRPHHNIFCSHGDINEQ